MLILLPVIVKILLISIVQPVKTGLSSSLEIERNVGFDSETQTKQNPHFYLYII